MHVGGYENTYIYQQMNVDCDRNLNKLHLNAAPNNTSQIFEFTSFFNFLYRIIYNKCGYLCICKYVSVSAL